MAPASTGEWEAQLGYALHPREQGKGLATEAVRAVVVLAFGRLRLRRIGARVFAPAVPSSRLLAKLGLRLEGRTTPAS